MQLRRSSQRVTCVAVAATAPMAAPTAQAAAVVAALTAPAAPEAPTGGSAVALPASAAASLADKIQQLKAERAEISAAKKRATKELANAQRKKARLQQKARGLSDEDILEVLRLKTLTRERRQQAADGMEVPSAIPAPGPPPPPPMSSAVCVGHSWGSNGQ